MDFIDPALTVYAENHSSPENTVLSELNRETNANVLMPRMLSGHLQGRFLSFISQLIKPVCILEIGTYTGYSALCLAEGLQKGGILHTIDNNDELTSIVNRFIKKAAFEDRIKTYIGNALQILPEINGPFDLVFIDADKQNYSAYYDEVFDKVIHGGIVIADNVLWSGKVLLSPEKMDKDTLALHQFNEKIRKDERVEVVLLPVRDGLLCIRKKSENKKSEFTS